MELLHLALNWERARQLQVHTAVEATRIAEGTPGSDAYYSRWANGAQLKTEAQLEDFMRRTRQ